MKDCSLSLLNALMLLFLKTSDLSAWNLRDSKSSAASVTDVARACHRACIV